MESMAEQLRSLGKLKLLIQKLKQCIDCNREYTNRTWHAIVQIRQKRSEDDQPRKGLNLIEMAISKNDTIRKDVLKIDITKQGFDFYFLSLVKAQGFASFISKIVPLKIKTTKKLVSTDVKNNTANMKHTVSCDMVPLCKDDLLMIHKKSGSGGVGNLSGRLCLVIKMSSVVHLADAQPKKLRQQQQRQSSSSSSSSSKRNKNKNGNNNNNLDINNNNNNNNNNKSDDNTMKDSTAELSPETYYKNGGEKSYRVISSSRRMIRFIVLDIELLQLHHDGNQKGNNNNNTNNQEPATLLYEGPSSGIDKYALADVEVIRESDLGSNDNDSFRCTTHLGHLLQVGDVVLGYDLVSLVLSSTDEFALENCLQSNFVMPDVVLVKKVQGESSSNTDYDVGDDGKERGKDSASSSNSNGKDNMKKSSSSKSKRKERQRKKKENKLNELQEAAERMGFVEEEEEEEEQQEQQQQQDTFEGEEEVVKSASNNNNASSKNVLVGDGDVVFNDLEFVAEVNATEEELISASTAFALKK